MLMVPACPESGSLGPAGWPRPTSWPRIRCWWCRC